MIESVWLQRHSENVKDLLKKDSVNKKKAVGITLGIFAIIIIIVFITNLSDMQNAMMSCGIIAGMACMVSLIVLLVSSKNTKKDAAKGVRQNLSKLLTTSEEVEAFDTEMTAAPLFEMSCGGTENDKVFMTEHYIGVQFLNLGLPDYRFAKRADIAATNFAITKDETKIKGMGKLYLVDLLNKNGQKVLGLSIHGRERMDELETALQKYCNGIQLKPHTR